MDKNCKTCSLNGSIFPPNWSLIILVIVPTTLSFSFSTVVKRHVTMKLYPFLTCSSSCFCLPGNTICGLLCAAYFCVCLNVQARQLSCSRDKHKVTREPFLSPLANNMESPQLEKQLMVCGKAKIKLKYKKHEKICFLIQKGWNYQVNDIRETYFLYFRNIFLVYNLLNWWCS